MLIELTLTDLALFERAGLEFGQGLNAVTGETGAGKSLVIDALELLLGARAKAAMVRKGAERARVEGRFALPLAGYGETVADWLAEHLPEALDEREDEAELELILTRTLGRDGKSRAHVNHRPVTMRLLRELTGRLVEIHGQNDHQRLFEPSEQLRLVDAFGSLEGPLAGYRERRLRWLELVSRLEALESGEAERLQRIDILRFQVQELSEADPRAEEADTLTDERAVLRNAADLGTELGEIAYGLSESEGAALDVVRHAGHALERWAERVPSLGECAQSVTEAGLYLEEAARALSVFLSDVDADPARLEEVETRLGLLERLMRKYGTDVRGLESRRSALDTELAGLQSGDISRDELAAEVEQARAALAESARRLTSARRGLSGKLRDAIQTGLADLGLERARFSLTLRPHVTGDDVDGSGGLATDRRRFGQNGAEGVELLLAANPGEDAQPLRTVASGGEAARILLALRGALSVRRSTPTLVFDEVDAGVGGRLGPKVANHLAALGEHHQVLCVTHLPSIAAKATRHLKVTKSVEGGRTITRVDFLKERARVEEIADMIAGGADEPTALAEAKRLLKN